MSGVDQLTQTELSDDPSGATLVRLKTDAQDIHTVSRDIFFAFARKNVALLEMSLKKANLEDIFIELTEQAPEGPQPETKEADEP